MSSYKQLSRALSPVARDPRFSKSSAMCWYCQQIVCTSYARSVTARPLLLCWTFVLATWTTVAKKERTRKRRRPASLVKKAVCIALKSIDPGMVESTVPLLLTTQRTSQRRVSCPSTRTRPLPPSRRGSSGVATIAACGRSRHRAFHLTLFHDAVMQFVFRAPESAKS
jgi:hypothetical protein